MRYKPTRIELTGSEWTTLESWSNSQTTEQRRVLRSRIILAAADDMGTNAVAKNLNIRPATVSKWRLRFAKQRVRGLTDKEGRGRKRRYAEETTKKEGNSNELLARDA